MSKRRNVAAAVVVPASMLLVDPAFAQEVAEVAGEVAEDPSWLPFAVGAIGYAVLAAVPAFVSSKHWWVKIVDAVAFNWGKARNDPGAQ